MLPIDPPLGPNELPVALTPNGGDILLRAAEHDQVTIENQTDRVVAYMMTAVPRALVTAATMPWKRIMGDLGHAMRENGLRDWFRALRGADRGRDR